MEMSDDLRTQIYLTVGFLNGMADGLKCIAPDKAERCQGFAESLLKAVEREKLSQEVV